MGRPIWPTPADLSKEPHGPKGQGMDFRLGNVNNSHLKSQRGADGHSCIVEMNLYHSIASGKR